MLLCLIFYGLEKVINCFRNTKENGKLDLASYILPGFIKRRKLELDEQILWENCHTLWTITTHRGPTKCICIKYDPRIGKHYVKFGRVLVNGKETTDPEQCRGVIEEHGIEKNENVRKESEPQKDQTGWEAMQVSIDGSVELQHECWLDFMHLHQVGLLDFEQFERVKVDYEWIQQAQEDEKDAIAKGTKSKYWICGYCRGYVKASHASIKQLARELKVNDVELKIINKVSPVVCPNCYRVRYERERYEFVWEMISIWIFYVIVFPLFFVIFAIVSLIRMVIHPREAMKNWKELRDNLTKAEKDLNAMYKIAFPIFSIMRKLVKPLKWIYDKCKDEEEQVNVTAHYQDYYYGIHILNHYQLQYLVK